MRIFENADPLTVSEPARAKPAMPTAASALKIFDIHFARYLLFAVGVAIAMRLEIGLLASITKIRPVDFNIDYLLIGAGPWQSLILAVFFLLDLLWAITRGGFFGIADFPILLENSFKAGWGGLAAFLAGISILTFNLLLVNITGRMFLKKKPKPSAILIFFLIAACATLALRSTDQRWKYRINSSAGSAAKNVAVDPFTQAAIFGRPAHFTYPPYYSLVAPIADLDKKNTLVVLFESWGLDSDGMYRALVDRNLASLHPHMLSNNFQGPTVYGELRELCGAKTDSLNIIEPPSNCLPDRLQALGVQTIAFHGNSGGFYRRNRWVPEVGFDMFNDKEAILKAFPEAGNLLEPTYDAIPDAAMLSIIDKIAKENSQRRKFYYFVSISSHGPYLSRPAEDRCTRYKATGELCDYYSRIDDTLGLIRKFSEQNPDFQILAVGDHYPYMLQKTANLKRFDNRHVPGFFIEARTPKQ